MNSSKIANLLKKNKESILGSWLKEVKQGIQKAQELPTPILIDTLPALLDNLAQALSEKTPLPVTGLDSTLANEHGGERARLTSFDLTALIQEFRLLRKILIQDLRKLSKGNLDDNSEAFIHIFIDESIQSSATAFCLVQSEFRDQLVATLTHDIRSPLAAASLTADLIKRNTSDEFILKNIKKIAFQHRRIEALVQDLLNTSLIRSGGKLILHVEPVNLNQLFREVQENLPQNFEQRSHFKCAEIEGYWDPKHLKRALENLISNAFKYGDHDKEVSISASTLYGRAIFNVHNFGRPIPMDEQETIFQAFRRAEAAKSGTSLGWGLGLPLVRAVAEAHGGSVSVNSFQDHGTTFIIDIPTDARPFLTNESRES